MSRSTRITFGVHWIVALLLGLPLLVTPGSFLEFINWLPDGGVLSGALPMVSRMFGAALIGLAWGSFRSWRASTWDQVGFIVELEIVFTVLASIGLLRHLIGDLLTLDLDKWPWTVWATLVVLVLFAVAWIVAFVRDRE